MRIVVESWKTGGYGTTMWHHKLDCGHVTSARRKIPAGKDLECSECDEEAAGLRRISSLPDPEAAIPQSHALEIASTPEPDDLSRQIEWASMVAAVIAAELRMPRDQVEVVVSDDGSVSGGMIVLTQQDIQGFLKRMLD